MPSRDVHRPVGMITGAAAAALSAREEEFWDLLLEMVGGGVAGYLGGSAPDWLEPALHPNHRSLAHSCATGGGIALSAVEAIPEIQAHCREQSMREKQLMRQSDDFMGWLWHGFLYVLWRVASGFVIGGAVGYGSHLMLDAGTPKGLPVVC